MKSFALEILKMITSIGNEFWARKWWCLLPATIMQICKCLQICKLDIRTTETNIVVLYLASSYSPLKMHTQWYLQENSMYSIFFSFFFLFKVKKKHRDFE